MRLALDYFGAGEEAAYYESLYGQCRGKKCIIFTNSRLEAEETINVLRGLAARKGDGDFFHVHHGSVSGRLRMDAERELREEEGPRTAAATATLELGIDLGRLDRIIQIGPPLSVSGFVQRLGRSGRLSGLPEMYFTSLERPPSEDTLVNDIPWNLLRTVAVLRLYTEEKWIEPAQLKALPYSLLIHQTLSVLGSLGEQKAPDLARRFLSLPPFLGVSLDDYRGILASLESHDYIEKTAEGGLILGLEGEYTVNHYSFYSVFPDEAEYKVIQGGRELGTVNFLPLPASRLALGGSYWQVESFDRRRGEIYVVPAPDGGERVWRGSGAEIHSRAVKMMKAVLLEERDYPFLSGRARLRLAGARRRGREQGLIREGPLSHEDLIPDGRGGFYLIPWMGSRALRTLITVLQYKEYQKALGLASLFRVNDYVLNIKSALPPEAFWHTLLDLAAEEREALSLLEGARIPLADKYDYLLSPELLARQYGANMLALDELREALE
jgi:ATP-dependent Lhr-like helicase